MLFRVQDQRLETVDDVFIKVLSPSGKSHWFFVGRTATYSQETGVDK